MERIFQRFVSEEKGAVAIDWLVLGIGVLGLGLAVIGTFSTPGTDLASDTAQRAAHHETLS